MTVTFDKGDKIILALGGSRIEGVADEKADFSVTHFYILADGDREWTPIPKTWDVEVVKPAAAPASDVISPMALGTVFTTPDKAWRMRVYGGYILPRHPGLIHTFTDLDGGADADDITILWEPKQ